MLDFIKSICRTIGSWINLRPLYVGIIGLALIVVLIAAVIVIAVCVSKKKKLAKAAAEKAAREKAEKELAEREAAEAEAKRVAEEKAAKEKAEKEAAEKAEAERVSKESAEKQAAEQAVIEEKTEQTAEAVKPEEKQVTVDNAESVSSEQTKPEAKKPAPKKPIEKKTATAKKAVAKEEEKPVKQPKKLNGKWTVEVKSADEYVAHLAASNGEIMLTSEIYTTEDGAKGGIATIIKGVDSGKFVIYQDKNANYYYKLKTANNRLLCVGEIYKSKDQCLKAVETVKRIAKDSVVVPELVEGSKYVDYTPAPLADTAEVKKGLRGKWRVETTEDGNFSAKLYANNGQLMLATEEVSLKKSAVSAIESVKKNSALGNFIIDKDKFGRYYYKLRNAQKSVICIGEAYESLDSCVNAIESVRRFAATAIVE